MKKNRPMRRKPFAVHWIPIYGNVFTFGIVENVDAFLKRPATIKVYGELDADEDTAAVMVCRGMQFGIFMDRRNITHNDIAHEVLHLTHRMLERHSVFLSPKHHEAHCYLCGYLTELVYGDLKKWRISIR